MTDGEDKKFENFCHQHPITLATSVLVTDLEVVCVDDKFWMVVTDLRCY